MSERVRQTNGRARAARAAAVAAALLWGMAAGPAAGQQAPAGTAPEAAGEQDGYRALVVTMNALVREGRTGEAFAAGQAAVAEHAGIPEFDFAYGMVAMHAGRVEHAVLAFERVVMARPRDDRARLELARAHYAAGNYSAARAQFERVLQNSPPPNVQMRVNAFLAQIEARRRAMDTRLVPHVSARLGYDDNVAAASERDIYIPALVEFFESLGMSAEPITLDRASDSFAELATGLDYHRPLDKNRSLFAALDLNLRNYSTESDFDMRTLDGAGGMAFQTGYGLVRVPLQVQHLQLGGRSYRSLLAVGGEWRQFVRPRTEANAFLRVGDLNYRTQAERDARFVTLGGGISQRLTDSGIQVFGTALFGTESADADHHSRDYLGLRAGLMFPVGAHQVGHLNLGWQDVSHDGQDPVFATKRSDTLVQASGSWAWQVDRRWRARASLDYYDNRSNIALYQYDRWQALLALRYAWQ